MRALNLKVVPALLVGLLASVASGQEQLFDPNFDARVARPAYASGRRPRVMFDEGHFNVHTSGGTYKPFADLLTSDGYRVSPGKEKFSVKSLRGYDVLVIADALGLVLRPTPAPKPRQPGATNN